MTQRITLWQRPAFDRQGLHPGAVDGQPVSWWLPRLQAAEPCWRRLGARGFRPLVLPADFVLAMPLRWRWSISSRSNWATPSNTAGLSLPVGVRASGPRLRMPYDDAL